MIGILSVIGIALFGIAAFLLRPNEVGGSAAVELRTSVDNNALAWTLGFVSLLAVIAAAFWDNDLSTPFRAAATAVTLVALPIGASLLWPEGLSSMDTGATAFVGFTIGVTSTVLAAMTFFIAVAVTGLLASLELIVHNDRDRRVPFAIVLFAVAIAVTVVA